MDTFNGEPYDDGFEWELASQDGSHEHYAHQAGQHVTIYHAHSQFPYQPHVHPEHEAMVEVLLASIPVTEGRAQPIPDPTEKPF